VAKKGEDKDDEKEKKVAEDEESEGGEDSPEDLEGGGKKLGKKMLIVVAVAGVLVLGGATVGALYFTGVIGGKKDDATGLQEKAARGKTVYYSLGDILVNLSGEGKRPNFLKIKVSLELADEKDVVVMDAIKPRIIDNFQVYLRELRVEDLRGSAGLFRLREELLLRVSEAAQPVRIRDVLFQEMLVQ